MRTEDGTIIQKCLNGESEAFGILIDKYKAGIFALVWHKIHNFHDAEEVTQEVFIKAYKHLSSLRRWDSFAVWLYSIAHERCRKWFRSQIRHPEHDLIEDRDVEELKESDAIDSYREDKMYDSLHDALDSLPKIYQEVLTLHYFGGLTGEEIARSLCITPSAVRQRLSRAREQLKEEMVAMMSETFKEHKLQANFTFRIVEIIKRIKIHPISTIKGLPYGVSLVVGIAMIIMSFNPSISQFITLDTPTGFPLPVETKTLKLGEIPVDTVKISQLPALSSEMGKGNDGKALNQSALLLAPQAQGGTWVKKGDMPVGIGYHSINELNGKIYIIGGISIINGKEVAVSTVYEYDLKADVWSKKADMPTPRTHFGACAVNGKIYAIGGWNLVKTISAVEEYDPIADKWVKKSDFPTIISGLTISQVNGKIYVIGGHNVDVGSKPALTTVFEYDTETDTWTKKADMPTGRCYQISCVFNNKIYVFGGTNDNVGTKLLSTTEMYDPSTNTWSKCSDMPKADSFMASCAMNGLIYVMGGWDTTKNLSMVEIYDPKNDKWSEGTNMPIPKHALTAYSNEANGKIYTIGGCGGGEFVWNYPPEIWEYTPEILQSAVSPEGKLPTKWGTIKDNR